MRLCSSLPHQVHRIIACRYVVPRVAFHTQPFLSRSANWPGANKWGEVGINPAAAAFLRRPPHDEQSIRSTSTERTIHTPLGFEGGPTITVMNDSAHSTLDGPLIGALNDGKESTMHMGEGKLFHGSPLLDDVNKVRREPYYRAPGGEADRTR